ncbi:MAG: hypothetical protein SF028_15695 [Candidatus Sumerlaeia bacterium]|nr:hypothetical protein [Candidatus Sumerlaeia bacterium]
MIERNSVNAHYFRGFDFWAHAEDHGNKLLLFSQSNTPLGFFRDEERVAWQVYSEILSPPLIVEGLGNIASLIKRDDLPHSPRTNSPYMLAELHEGIPNPPGTTNFISFDSDDMWRGVEIVIYAEVPGAGVGVNSFAYLDWQPVARGIRRPRLVVEESFSHRLFEGVSPEVVLKRPTTIENHRLRRLNLDEFTAVSQTPDSQFHPIPGQDFLSYRPIGGTETVNL